MAGPSWVPTGDYPINFDGHVLAVVVWSLIAKGVQYGTGDKFHMMICCPNISDKLFTLNLLGLQFTSLKQSTSANLSTSRFCIFLV